MKAAAFKEGKAKDRAKGASTIVKKKPVPWEERYNELVAYKRKHNNCNVPRKYKANPALGRWVVSQRSHYKCKKSFVTAERIVKLHLMNSIGFIWNLQEYNWQQSFHQLAAFQDEHKHCFVPTGNTLGNWVSIQRQQYKLFMADKPSRMTTEHIEKLNELGFVWKVPQSRPRLWQQKTNSRGGCQIESIARSVYLAMVFAIESDVEDAILFQTALDVGFSRAFILSLKGRGGNETHPDEDCDRMEGCDE